MAQIQGGLHGPDRRNRFLLWGRNGEPAGGATGRADPGGGPVLWVASPSGEVGKIKAAILVHHGELDKRLAATWPAYDLALKEANVPHEGYIYAGAGHGFHCDATPERYNRAAAELAWKRTVDWFNKYVRG